MEQSEAITASLPGLAQTEWDIAQGWTRPERSHSSHMAKIIRYISYLGHIQTTWVGFEKKKSDLCRSG